MTTFTCLLPTWDIQNKRIILRADLNVPLENGVISNDYRLQSLKPTLDYIRQHGGTTTILTHIGRPESPTPALSTKHLLPWFKDNGYVVTWCATIQEAQAALINNNQSFILLENLRFFPGEKDHDTNFARDIAQLGDFYLDDAFASLHRDDSSITLVPTFFPPEKRSVGLLVEKELTMLDKLMISSKKPFALVTGGGKVTDKIPLLFNMLNKVTDILLCPATVFSFLYAQGKECGISLIDKNAATSCNEIITRAQQQNVTIHFPLDYQMSLDNTQGEIVIVDAHNIPHNGIGLSIGPKTIERYSHIIRNAHTIFFNAAMGFPSRPETTVGTQALLHAIAQSNGFSVIGGGDSVAAAQKLQLDGQIDYLSTGGGATLTYLSGQELPGLKVLSHIK